MRWEEFSQVRSGFRPRLPIPRERPLCPASFHLKSATYEDVWASDDPNEPAGLPVRRRQLAFARPNTLYIGRPLPPEIAGKVRPVYPQAVADQVRILGFVFAVILDRISMSPAPGDSLIGSQRHVHVCIGDAVAVPFRF